MNEAISSILDTMNKNEIKFVDFRFTSTSGRSFHITHHVDNIDHKTFLNGITFDSSSVKGWKPVENSDMLLKPDLSSKSAIFFDPFTAQATLCIICDVIDTSNNKNYTRDPRSTAKRAEKFLKESGIADSAYFGLEMEFFIFDDARFEIRSNGAFFELDSSEGRYNSGRKYEYNNHGHRYNEKDCYLSSQPNDTLNDIRAEILQTLKEINIKPTLHHHEIASSQCEVGFQYGEILEVSDNFQKCKYVVHNVASSYGKSATFMPKPIQNDNGSGMNAHQSLWLNKQNIFSSNNGSGLSDICLYYIGGILKHGRALSAFTNPTVNSYKRLITGEAPTALIYSYCNRTAAIRIPHAVTFESSGRRIEVRFPDVSANPYLATTAMLMAGIDGIKNKIHPGDTVDENLFKSGCDSRFSYLPKSLDEAIDALKKDRNFLTEGDVFSNDQIDAYITLLQGDVDDYGRHITPVEFIKYYNI